jgi:excisionase family DNA binding protein
MSASQRPDTAKRMSNAAPSRAKPARRPASADRREAGETIEFSNLLPLAGKPLASSKNGGPVMTLNQTATYLGISKAHLSNVINGRVAGAPLLRHARVGRRVLIRRDWVDDFLEMAA